MRFILLMMTLFFPAIAGSADSAFSFSPPTTDLSVVFLSNIFGVVDGVLHGTGSQIMGEMFSILNAAILALGGIVIMYTLIVGTMNTAHEGEMLGHKWSSIWIPVRATLGLALLLPKASGYCLIQIFVMWVIVQGVGAADKVWNAALSYLNRGGVIIHAQMSPGSTDASAALTTLYVGAGTILSAQVCMLGLQKQAEAYRLVVTSGNTSNTTICSSPEPGSDISRYCSTSVPSFLSTVNFVDVQTRAGEIASYTVSMPNFPPGSPYTSFNKKCGLMTWNAVIPPAQPGGMTADETAIFKQTRALALQQMYDDLSPVAQQMINNDPQINPPSSGASTGLTYTEPFGVPKLSNGQLCTTSSSSCTGWGAESSGSFLFSGTEFVGSVYDYDNVMMPTLNYIAQSNRDNSTLNGRAFIEKTQADGWMTAGQYFFDLVKLNGNVTAESSIDNNSGFPKTIDLLEMKNMCTTTNPTDLFGNIFCNEHGAKQSLLDIANLVGTNPPSFKLSEGITGDAASTAYGFINNSSMVHLPGQAGLQIDNMFIDLQINPDKESIHLDPVNRKCEGPNHGLSLTCVRRAIEDAVYNYGIMPVANIMFGYVTKYIARIVEAVVSVPIALLSSMVTNGFNQIIVLNMYNDGTNPIVALAQLGTYYINELVNMILGFFVLSFPIAITGTGGLFIVGLATPFISSWMAMMAGIGIMTAYYIPFYPYMLFTFGVIAWLMAVIEAVVAAPIIALGITHPEGEGILGKGEQALMILMNVFLRPAMMIVGYIAGIIMCYVSVWILNVGFQHVAEFTQTVKENGYSDFAGMYGGVFALLLYTSIYMTVVQKSFSLIYHLPDKVLRWIGGHPETVGGETAQWSDDSKQKIKEEGDAGTKSLVGMTGKIKSAMDGEEAKERNPGKLSGTQ